MCIFAVYNSSNYLKESCVKNKHEPLNISFCHLLGQRPISEWCHYPWVVEWHCMYRNLLTKVKIYKHVDERNVNQKLYNVISLFKKEILDAIE